MVNTEVVPHSNSNDWSVCPSYSSNITLFHSVAVPSSVISPLWLMLISQCTTEGNLCVMYQVLMMCFLLIVVLLLPLVTEVILKLLLITDHPASMADAIIHRLGDAAVAREFMKGYVCNGALCVILYVNNNYNYIQSLCH